jgi:hypothetical protein
MFDKEHREVRKSCPGETYPEGSAFNPVRAPDYIRQGRAPHHGDQEKQARDLNGTKGTGDGLLTIENACQEQHSRDRKCNRRSPRKTKREPLAHATAGNPSVERAEAGSHFNGTSNCLRHRSGNHSGPAFPGAQYTRAAIRSLLIPAFRTIDRTELTSDFSPTTRKDIAEW